MLAGKTCLALSHLKKQLPLGYLDLCSARRLAGIVVIAAPVRATGWPVLECHCRNKEDKLVMTSKGPGKPDPSNSVTKIEVLHLNLSSAAASRSEEAGGFSGALFQDVLTGRPVGITALQKETERVTEGDFRTQHRGSNTLNEGVKRERVTPSGKTVFTHELWIILGESGWDSA